MQHLEEGTIHAFLDGALDAEEAARVEQHAAECAQCASAVAEARGLVAGASRILSALDDAPSGVAPQSPVFGAGTRTAQRQRSVWRVLRLTPARAAAAAVVILAAGTALVMRNGTPNGLAVSRRLASDTAAPFGHSKAPVSASPLPAPPVATASADSVAVMRQSDQPPARPGRPARRASIVSAPVAPTPSPTAVAEQSAPSAKVMMDKRARAPERSELKMAAADSMTVAQRRDSSVLRDSARALEAAVPAAAPQPPPSARNAGVAGGIARASSVSRDEVRMLRAPVTLNYAGCYSVTGQSGDASLAALPSTLSLDSMRLQRTAPALMGGQLSSFGVSAIADGSRRPIENTAWQPLVGQLGIRLSLQGRAPIVFAASGDSLLSAPTMTLRRMNCPAR